MNKSSSNLLLKKFGNTNKSYSNRGMSLESDINLSNEYYKVNDIAYINKKPTPIKLVKVDYHKNMIKEAYFDTPSTTDYNGIYKGKYIDFEAKETTSKTSFPLSNIHNHQMEHIKKVIKFGGIAYLIVRFCMLDKTYLLLGEDLISFVEQSTRKSIPIDFFDNNCKKIDIKYRPRLDYLKSIDIL